MTIKNGSRCGCDGIKPLFFCITSAGMLVVEFFFLPGYQNLALIGLYTFLLTGLILIVKKRYRELIWITEAPVLPLPAKLKNDREKRPVRDQEKFFFNLSEILIEEFLYAKETAAQVMDDRQTITNTYLVSIGGTLLVSIAYTLATKDTEVFPLRDQGLVALCLLINAVGWFFFFLIVRLRQAWCESSRAMNHIKQVFVKNCQFDSVIAKKCFRWDINSSPKVAKKMTVFYFSAVLISIPSSMAIVMACMILLGKNNNLALWLMSLSMGCYHFIFQVSMYSTLLEEVYKRKSREL